MLFSGPDLRLRVTADPMVALIDMAMLFTGHNNDEAGEMWHRLQLSSCSRRPSALGAKPRLLAASSLLSPVKNIATSTRATIWSAVTRRRRSGHPASCFSCARASVGPAGA
jgi:hypothetical protein